MTNVPRTNLIDAFQRLQSARKATDPENSPSYREGNNIESMVSRVMVRHENDRLCSACALSSARRGGAASTKAIGVPTLGWSLSSLRFEWATDHFLKLFEILAVYEVYMAKFSKICSHIVHGSIFQKY
jgi:hypothetical protein